MMVYIELKKLIKNYNVGHPGYTVLVLNTNVIIVVKRIIYVFVHTNGIMLQLINIKLKLISLFIN